LKNLDHALLRGRIEQPFQLVSAHLKFAEGRNKRGTHAFPGSRQPLPFDLKLGFEASQSLQFFDYQFFVVARHGIGKASQLPFTPVSFHRSSTTKPIADLHSSLFTGSKRDKTDAKSGRKVLDRNQKSAIALPA
jgi:hypothetical protein